MTTTALPAASFRVGPGNDIFKTKEKIAYANSLTQKCYRVANAIFSIIIFPIGIGRLVVFLVKKLAPAKILPGINLYNLTAKLAKYEKEPSERLEDEIQYLQHLHDFRDTFIATPANNATQVTIGTPDSIELDACSIKSSNQVGKPEAEQKWVIYFQGSNSCYEGQLNELKLIATRTGANVLSANYRGIMRSKGRPTCSHDLILDGEAQVQYLVRLGAAKENILLHGWSLGGAVATEVASNHQEKGHEINLCNERSFSDLTEMLKTHLPDILGLTVKNILGFIAGKFVYEAGWKFDGTKNYQKINGRKWIIYSKEDGYAKYPASLYKGLKELLMTDEDRNLKNLRSKAKKITGKPQSKDYDQYYKPKNTHNLSYAQKRNRDEVVKKHGMDIHCKPISATKEVFDRYVLQVKEVLRLEAGEALAPPTAFQTFKSFLAYQLGLT